MAYLIGDRRVYLFNVTEDNTNTIKASEHSVEDGVDLTDHIRPEAEQMSISGEIVGSSYKTIIATIKSWEQSGKVCRYIGQTSLAKCLIHDFRTSHSSDIRKGCTFSMDLKTVRISKPAYVPPATTTPTNERVTVDSGTQSVEVNNADDMYHEVKSGDTVWGLTHGAYSKYGKSCEWIMENNPDAFSTPGDFTTLKIGVRLKMGD